MTNAYFEAKTWNLGTAAPTNRLIVSGGGLASGTINSDSWQANQPNAVKGLTEFLFTDGACVTNTTACSFGYNQGAGRLNSSNQTYRYRVENGATWRVHSLSFGGLGRGEVLVRGKDSVLCPYSNGSNIGTADGSSAYIEIADGALGDFRQPLSFGSSSYPTTSWGELCISNATAKIPDGVNLTFNNGRVSLLDNALVQMSGGTSGNVIKAAGGSGVTQEFVADGGVISISGYAVDDPIQGFPVARLGPKGLAIKNIQANEAKTVSATFTDLTAGGRLVLSTPQIAYPMTLSSAASDESFLDIVGGKVQLASGANHNSFITVTNGAVFSLAGNATAATLRGLKLGDATSSGTLELDTNDVVTLSGPFDIANGTVTYSSNLGEGAHTVFAMTTEPAAALKSFWAVGAKASFTSGLDATKYNIFTCQEEEGVWNFKITVYATISAKAGDATWAGPGANWSDQANWQGEVKPDGTHGARFAGATPTAVTVPEAAESAGLTFDSADGYTLSGDTVNMAFNAGSSIGVSNGTHTIACGIYNPYFMTDVIVETNAALTLSGPYTGAGIRKSGAGALTLTSAANFMTDGITLQEGTLRATPAALNVGGSTVVSTLAGGTLELTGAGSASPNVNVTGSVTLKSDSAASSLAAPSASSGSALNKIGAGDFTLTVDRDRTMSASLNVYEGALRLDGDGTHKLSSVGVLNIYSRGLSAAGAPQPGLVLNDTSLSSSGDLNLGVHGGDGELAQAPYVAVSNSLMQVQNVDSGKNSDTSIRPRADFYKSTLRVVSSGGFCPGGRDFTSSPLLTHWSFTDSRLELTYDERRFLVFKAPYEMFFDNSVLCRTKWDTTAQKYVDYGSIQMSLGGGWNTAHGTFLFKNGSKLCCQRILYSTSETDNHTLPSFNFTFEDSEWFVADANMSVPSSNMNVTVTAQGTTGIVFAPPAARTWTLFTPIAGTGAFTKRGAGTLNVVAARRYNAPLADPRTLQTTGALRIEGGLLAFEANTISNIANRAVAFADGGILDYGGMTLASPTFSGTGEITNAVITTPTFALGRAADDAPTGCVTCDFAAVSGQVSVDFGRADDDESLEPFKNQSFVVAQWRGSKPNVASWRARHVGAGLAVAFAATDEGDVLATVMIKPGMLIIVR